MMQVSQLFLYSQTCAHDRQLQSSKFTRLRNKTISTNLGEPIKDITSKRFKPIVWWVTATGVASIESLTFDQEIPKFPRKIFATQLPVSSE